MITSIKTFLENSKYFGQVISQVRGILPDLAAHPSAPTVQNILRIQFHYSSWYPTIAYDTEQISIP